MEYNVVETQILQFFKNNDVLLKLIGYSDELYYNYLMKQIWNIKNQNSNIYFYDKGFPIPTNTQVIQVVQRAASTMDLNNLQKEELCLTGNDMLNNKIKQNIVDILQNRLREPFKNDNIKLNFFIKQIVTLYEFIQKFELETKKNNPIIIYYGNVSEQDLYQLQLLYKLNVKILYIHSFQDIDIGIGKTIKLDNISQIQPFSNLITKAVKELPKEVIEEKIEDNTITTWAGQAKEELLNTLYDNQSVIQPWKFKKHTTKDMTFNAVIEDIDTYWNEMAKVRPQFSADSKEVIIPHFFTKINGVYEDLSKYANFIKKVKENELTIFKDKLDFLPNNFSLQETASLGFTFHAFTKELYEDKLKANKLYHLEIVNSDVQHLIYLKLNEFLQKYKSNLTDKEIVSFISIIINCPEEFLRLIENFDFAYKIPKCICYLYDRTNLELNYGLFFKFLSCIGFDVIILSPIGTDSLENYMYNGETLNTIVLEEMKFDFPYNDVQQYEKMDRKRKGFFSNLFS